LLKYLHQTGRSPVDRAQRRHNTATEGPAPSFCIGPRTCWGRA